jgi:hypothetical protein
MLFQKLHNSLNTFVPLSLVLRIHKFVVCEGISVCHTFSLSLSLLPLKADLGMKKNSDAFLRLWQHHRPCRSCIIPFYTAM